MYDVTETSSWLEPRLQLNTDFQSGREALYPYGKCIHQGSAIGITTSFKFKRPSS